jgi:hypothetical protein
MSRRSDAGVIMLRQMRIPEMVGGKTPVITQDIVNEIGIYVYDWLDSQAVLNAL